MNGRTDEHHKGYKIEVVKRLYASRSYDKWEAVVSLDGRHQVTKLGHTESDARLAALEWIDEQLSKQK